MKNLLQKTMLLLFALIVGSSSVWADEVYYTFTTKANGSNSAYASTYDVTISGLSWNVPGNQFADGGLRIGGKGGSKASSVSTFDRIITGKSAIGEDITKITFNHGGISNANCVVNSVTLTVADNSSFTDGVDYELTPSFSLNTDGSFDFVPTAPATVFAKDSYYKFTINQTITGSSNYYLLVKSIDFYYAGGGGSNPSITLGSTSVNAPETAVSTTTINVTYNNLTNYDADVIFYESDGATAATYDHSWLTAEINASTKNLDYSITANTGAARTAYLRVYALGDEGDAESSLITITQAAKTVTKPEFNLDGGSYMQGTNITISSTGNTVYYNLTTDGSAPATPTNASTEYTAPIVLGSGTTKITAIAYDTYGNASSTTTRTYTSIALASLPFSWTGTSSAGKSDLGNQTGVELSLGSDYAASNAPYRLKFDGTTKHITIYTDAKPENVYFTAKLFNNASTGSKIKIQGSTDGISFTDIEEFTIKGSANDTFEFSTSNAFAATHRAVKLVMSSKDQNVAVGTICINCIPVTISAAKYATYVNGNYDLSFDGTNVTAYVVSEDAASSVTLTTVTEAPKNTPLIIKSAAAGIYNVNCIENAAAVGTNLLQVSHGNVTSDGSLYALAQEGGVVGFHQVADGVTIPEGKCYLESSNAVKSFLGFNVDDDATGISEIQGSNSKVNGSGIYTISGQRVNTMTRGLYIVNGKKVIIK